ncbi:MAG: ubiquitin-conjugating enzyme E2 variant [Planctomycetota bacterium]
MTEGTALAESSDLLELRHEAGEAPRRYVGRFTCKGLVTVGGAVEEAGRFEVGIWFPDEYLRSVEPTQIVTWLSPPNILHPNIRPPLICLGHLWPGSPLVDILYQTFEVITCKKVTMDERDALNPSACVWARQHQDRFPVDPRPLKRRRVRLNVAAESSAQETSS